MVFTAHPSISRPVAAIQLPRTLTATRVHGACSEITRAPTSAADTNATIRSRPARLALSWSWPHSSPRLKTKEELGDVKTEEERCQGGIALISQGFFIFKSVTRTPLRHPGGKCRGRRGVLSPDKKLLVIRPSGLGDSAPPAPASFGIRRRPHSAIGLR